MDADLNIPVKGSGRVACHIACLHGYTDILVVLLRSGASVFEIDRAGAFPMHLAAEGGDVKTVKLLLAVGALHICKDLDNQDPLHYAARSDQSATIEALHGRGSSLEVRDKNGATPLHVAATHGTLGAIRKLVELGADLNSRDKDGETPLHHAVRVSNVKSIEVICDLGADVRARNQAFECPLHLAARLDLWQSAQQLFKSGADIAIEWKKGLQSIHIAAINNSCQLLSLLALAKCDLNVRDKHKSTAIHQAVLHNRPEALAKLVKLGADVNAPGKRGDTAVHMAVRENKMKTVQQLVNLKADVNLENKDCVFPLYYSAVNDDLAMCKCLLRCGADINKVNSEGDGMVHILVEEEKYAGLALLQQLRMNMGLRNKKGQTVVHICSSEHNLEGLKQLKHVGADLSARNKYGFTALHEAVVAGDLEGIEILHNVGVDLDFPTKNFPREDDSPPVWRGQWPPRDLDLSDFWKVKLGLRPVHLAFLHGHTDILTHLVTCGADVNAADDDGESVFHLAVFYNLLNTVTSLVTLGADRNCRDKGGRTPLHYAAHTGNLDAIRLLLKYGASITEEDNDGRQALHYAAEGGHYLLLPEFSARNRAVDFNCTDSRGSTPLHQACRSGHLETIAELIQLGADVQKRDNTGNTVVHSAAGSGQLEVIAKLASLECSMDAQNTEGKTALHVAGETGQGGAMELFLLCGADPNIRDLNDNLASTYRLTPDQKRAVSRLVKHHNDDQSSRHLSGEISFDCRVVRPGKPIEFDKLGVTVTLAADSGLDLYTGIAKETETTTEIRPPRDILPIVFLHRTPAESGQMEIPAQGLEEVLSDIYELRVYCMDSPCRLTLEVPLDGYPGRFEGYFRCADGTQFPEVTTSEENGIPLFVGSMPVKRGCTRKFAVIVRPRVYSHTVGEAGSTLMAEADRRIRLEVPQHALSGPTTLNLQVLKTSEMERSPYKLFAADLINVTLTRNLQGQVRVQLPLHVHTDNPDDVTVFCIPKEGDIEQDHQWLTVQSPLRIANGCLMFNVSHFSMFVPVFLPHDSMLTTDSARRAARDRIRAALLRETSVLFFYAVCPKKDAFLTIFECTTPGRFRRRQEFWEREGFQFHPQVKHSGHFPAKPNQAFYFEVKGNVQLVGDSGRLMKLTFNPRSYKYQSFYLVRVQRRQPMIGEIVVTTSATDDVDGGFVTSIPIEIPETGFCVIA
ncbi:serine/threonine-protein phosphatase 6 regulatory ankyrin repeat subunit A-like isoform X2 [Mya arenaria]|nr:serine/threonine-protein phosphatase 6 regulatory ankyrin repeat subunit A-like isoform X2 [Mya arenaria]